MAIIVCVHNFHRYGILHSIVFMNHFSCTHTHSFTLYIHLLAFIVIITFASRTNFMIHEMKIGWRVFFYFFSRAVVSAYGLWFLW